MSETFLRLLVCEARKSSRWLKSMEMPSRQISVKCLFLWVVRISLVGDRDGLQWRRSDGRLPVSSPSRSWIERKLVVGVVDDIVGACTDRLCCVREMSRADDL